jgi:signal transduction histidine kinase
MADWYSDTLLLACGVCLGFALHAAMLLWQSRERRYAYLFVLAVLQAAYCGTTFAYFAEQRPERALRLAQTICIFTPFITYVFADLVVDLTGGVGQRRWFPGYQRVNLAGTSAFALMALSDAALRTHLVTGVVVTDLATLHRHRLSFTPVGEVWLGWVSLSFFLFAGLLFQGYRARRNLAPMVVGCALYFAATISDFGILSNLYDAYFGQHFGFFALVAGCWWVLADRYEVSVRELEVVVATLEEQRRKLLVSPTMVHKHKLDGIGALAAGVAHEINNPVQGIMNYAELLKRQVTDPVARGFADEITTECQRVTRIVKALLSLSRKDDGQIGGVALREIVDDVAHLVRQGLDSGSIRLEVEIGADVPEIPEGAPELRQVLMNLVTNACDALATREPSRRDAKCIRVLASTRMQAAQLWLVVDTIDNADGIEPGLLDRIFDPFFTTKPPGRGTGLGLAISHEIAASKGGRLSCETAVGQGSLFRIELPLGDATRPVLRSGSPRAHLST